MPFFLFFFRHFLVRFLDFRKIRLHIVTRALFALRSLTPKPTPSHTRQDRWIGCSDTHTQSLLASLRTMSEAPNWRDRSSQRGGFRPHRGGGSRGGGGFGGGDRGRGRGRGGGGRGGHRGGGRGGGHGHGHGHGSGGMSGVLLGGDPSQDPQLAPRPPHPGFFHVSFLENPWRHLEAKAGIPHIKAIPLPQDLTVKDQHVVEAADLSTERVSEEPLATAAEAEAEAAVQPS